MNLLDLGAFFEDASLVSAGGRMALSAWSLWSYRGGAFLLALEAHGEF